MKGAPVVPGLAGSPDLVGPTPDAGLLAGPRVGIGYAAPADRDAALRFAAADSARVSQRGSLRATGSG